MSVHDELITLCRDMNAAGQMLTYETLRARRGGGSRRDIAQAIQVWRAENPNYRKTPPGRPSRVEADLRAIIEAQQATITDQEGEIAIHEEEIKSLARMVRKYRGYPEDLEKPK